VSHLLYHSKSEVCYLQFAQGATSSTYGLRSCPDDALSSVFALCVAYMQITGRGQEILCLCSSLRECLKKHHSHCCRDEEKRSPHWSLLVYHVHHLLCDFIIGLLRVGKSRERGKSRCFESCKGRERHTRVAHQAQHGSGSMLSNTISKNFCKYYDHSYLTDTGTLRAIT
jgi:hypothetical protein